MIKYTHFKLNGVKCSQSTFSELFSTLSRGKNRYNQRLMLTLTVCTHC